ncbi:MAG: glycine cleavage system aminomethyltransferase GcvT [Mariniblastus sp.]
MTTVEQLLKTPLHQWHVDNNGRMVDFAGWSMPVQYSSIMDEHHQTRKAIGMFDVSHMGRLYFTGSEIDVFLDTLTTRRVAGVECGKIRYSLMTNDSGGILDDVLVYHLPDINGKPFHMMVVNASNRDKIVNWIQSKIGDSGIKLTDRTTETAMLAIQGPKANEAVAKLSEINPDSLPYYTGTTTKVCGAEVILSRTGYTGEDGCEIICANEHAHNIWSEVHKLAADVGGGATGLAARDTLRLEAGMPLYGHELNEETNPAQTDLKFAIQMKGREFTGRSTIAAARKDATLKVRVGLELEGRRAAREDCQILNGEQNIGFVTSGTYAPTLEKSISMAYIDPNFATIGTEVIVDIRGKSHPAKVVEVPFYKRAT